MVDEACVIPIHCPVYGDTVVYVEHVHARLMDDLAQIIDLYHAALFYQRGRNTLALVFDDACSIGNTLPAKQPVPSMSEARASRY